MDDCFKAMTTNHSKALAISRSHALNNPFRFIENNDFFCFPVSDDVVILQIVMLFRKFHHLLPTINEKIRSIAESGLLMKWQKESLRVGLSDSSDDTNKGDGALMTLQLEHVEGAFLVVLIGLSVAFVVFLLELLTHWLISKKESMRILKTIESFLCHA